VHGGLSAMIVDEALGALVYLLKREEVLGPGPAFTAHLGVDYKKVRADLRANTTLTHSPALLKAQLSHSSCADMTSCSDRSAAALHMCLNLLGLRLLSGSSTCHCGLQSDAAA